MKSNNCKTAIVFAYGIIAFSILPFVSCNNNTNTPSQTEGNRVITPSQAMLVTKEIDPLDKSPLDIAWYPDNYPLEKYKGTITGDAIMRVIYSRPHLNGRIMGKDLAKPDTLWRMGANENNEIEFFRAVRIGGSTIAPGKYILFCKAGVNSWKFYISKDINTWGLQLDTTKAVATAVVQVQKAPYPIESLTMHFMPANKGAALHVYWGEAKAVLDIDVL
jgi:hypothetical protein